MNRTALITLTIGIAILLGLFLFRSSKDTPDTTPSAESPTAPATESSQSAPPALPEAYLAIAPTLAQKLLPDREAFAESAEKGGEGEALARLHEFVLSMKSARSDHEDLNYIAEIASKGYTDNLESYETLKSLPESPGFMGDLLKAAALNHFAGPVAALKPIVDNFSKRTDREEKQITALRAQALAMEKVRAASLLLPRIVEKHAPTAMAPAGRFQVDFDENWAGAASCDWLQLFNDGPALTNATVRTKLRGKDADTRENVHFVAHWPSKAWLHTRYDAGQIIMETEVWRTSVTNVTTIEVDIWSPSIRWKQTYAYQGAERDKDIESICESLKLKVSYTPYEEGIFLDRKSRLSLTMTGVPQLPTTQLTAVFEEDSKQETVSWTTNGWSAEKKMEFKIANDAIDFAPKKLGIRLEFPPNNAAWEKSFKFK